MTLTVFDLPSTIRGHNALYPDACLSESETLGLDAFSPERQQFMEEGFYLYHNVYYEKKGFHPAGINSCRTILRSLKDLKLLDSISSLRKFVGDRSEEKRLSEAFLEREEKAKALKLDVFFTHYHCEALLQAFEYLRIIESALEQDKAEIEKARKRRFNKIPDDIFLEMWGYFHIQLEIVQEQYQRLTEAMLERLRHAFEEGDLVQADVFSALVKRYREEGMVEPNYTVPAMPADKLTPEIFHRFHQAIFLYGDEASRAKLSQFPWLDAEKPSLLIKQQVVSRLGILNDMPSKPKKPRFLFLGHNLRYEWFNEFYSFAQIDAHLRKAKLCLAQDPEAIFEETLSTLELQASIVESLIAEEKARCEACFNQLNTWWRRPFNKKTLEFINKIYKEISRKERIFLQQNAQLKKRQEDSLSYRHRLGKENKLLESIRPELCSISDSDVQNLMAYCKDLNPYNHLDKNFRERLEEQLEEIIDALIQNPISENISSEAVQRYIRLVEALGNTQQRQRLAEKYDHLQHEFEQEVNLLDKKLMDCLFSMPNFEFTESSQKYWLMRRNQMMAEQYLSVADLPHFNLADEVFFGIERNLFGQAPKGPRQIIGFLINFTTSMLYGVKKLVAISDPILKTQKIEELKSSWLFGLKGIENKALEEVFMQHWDSNHHQIKVGVTV